MNDIAIQTLIKSDESDKNLRSLHNLSKSSIGLSESKAKNIISENHKNLVNENNEYCQNSFVDSSLDKSN